LCKPRAATDKILLFAAICEANGEILSCEPRSESRSLSLHADPLIGYAWFLVLMLGSVNELLTLFRFAEL
jgi:hypothetical protein